MENKNYLEHTEEIAMNLNPGGVDDPGTGEGGEGTGGDDPDKK